MYGEFGGAHPLARFVNHDETFGRHVIRKFARSIVPPRVVVDIGADAGKDLAIVGEEHSGAKLVAIDCLSNPVIHSVTDHVHQLDIERDRLPFDDASVDLFISNQTLEHTKDIWWIFHEMTRCLKVGGYLFIGVPNIASLHTRIRLLFGIHPSQQKTCSAHVRTFSRDDLMAFVENAYGGYKLMEFTGSQFYPFPTKTARTLAKAFPTMAVSIYFLLHKTKWYEGQFLEYPKGLETNFYLGPSKAASA